MSLYDVRRIARVRCLQFGRFFTDDELLSFLLLYVDDLEFYEFKLLLRYLRRLIRKYNKID